MAQRDNFAAAGVTARGQDSGLVSFRAAVGEERFGQPPARRERCDLLCERRLRLGGEHRGDMLQRIHLAVDRGVHPLVAMAHADRQNAAEKIQIFAAVRIVNELVLGARDHQRFAVVMKDRRIQELLAGEENFVFRHDVAIV